MSLSEAAVEAAVEAALGALDGDVRSYIASLLTAEDGAPAGAQPDDDAVEAVRGLVLSSADELGGEDAAEAALSALVAQLRVGDSAAATDTSAARGSGTGRGAAPPSPPGPRKLQSSVKIADIEAQRARDAPDPMFLGGLAAAAAAAAGELRGKGDGGAGLVRGRAMDKAARKEARRAARREAYRAAQEEREALALLEMERQIAEASGIMLGLDDVGLGAGGAGADSTGSEVDVKFSNFDLPSKGDSGMLLSDANLTLAHGRRYGLVGLNGCGKSTLLQAMAMRSIPGIPRRLRLTLVKQEVVASEQSALQVVVAADMTQEVLGMRAKRLRAAVDAAAALGEGASKEAVAAAVAAVEGGASLAAASLEALQDQLADVEEQLAAAEDSAGELEARAIKILTGLGFTAESRAKATRELSGGWRMRVAIAAALFSKPDLLLLDEPTNHLDLESVIWLADHLSSPKFTSTLVVVSHDRAFLNQVVTDVVHFHHNRLLSYRGDVTSFEEVRRARAATQQRQRDAQEMKRKHLQEYITKHAEMGSNGPKAAAQRKSRMKKMERLGVEAAGSGKRYKASYDAPAEEVQQLEEDAEVVLTFPDPGSEFARDTPLISLDEAGFSYHGDKPYLLQGLNFSVSQASRVALLGRNGCGKSTLIKLLVGELEPVVGTANRNRHCRVEYIAQHQVEQLDLHSTPLDFIGELFPGDGSRTHTQALRQHLASFGLGGDKLPMQRIYTLSGGQKCRLCLAIAMYRKPHLLVLDEPTNHLDVETIDALVEAIKAFRGGVLVVSHDQHLLSAVCEDLWLVEAGTVRKYRGNFAAYRKQVLKAAAAAARAGHGGAGGR